MKEGYNSQGFAMPPIWFFLLACLLPLLLSQFFNFLWFRLEKTIINVKKWLQSQAKWDQLPLNVKGLIHVSACTTSNDLMVINEQNNIYTDNL